jgi:GT2 family glycosyltransferase
MEEIDLCWKIHRTSQKIYYTGKSVVYHVGAGTLGYESPFKTYLNFRNGLSLVFKHFSSSELWYKFPIRMALDWVASFVFLVNGKTRKFASVWRAHKDFWLSFSKNRKKRKEIQQLGTSYSNVSILTGMILFYYYFKKKRKFSLIVPDRTPLP